VTFILDANGIIRHRGLRFEKEISEAVNALLAENRPRTKAD
jgi:hypothetical protein